MRGVELHRCPGSPLVVSVPHTGTWVPAAVAARLAVPVAVVQQRVDAFAWDVACTAIPHATVVRAVCARAVVDPNRSGTVTAVDLHSDPDADGERLVRLYGRQGESLWRARPGVPAVSAQELARRVRLYHEPYHRALEAALAQAPRPCLLVDVHSMDESAFDLVIGDHRGRSAGVQFCERVVRRFFAERGYRVGYAGPRSVDRRGRPLSPVAVRHSGGFIASRYGDPAGGCLAVQLEVSRATAERRLAAVRADFGAFFAFASSWLRQQAAAAAGAAAP